MKFLIMLLCGAIGMGIGFYVQRDKDIKFYRVKELDMAENSFATGCLQKTQLTCSFLTDDKKRGDCYEEGLNFCPSQATKFRIWIQNGLK